jgi:hypothetical protein
MNSSLSFQGHNLQGTGFILDKESALNILRSDEKYKNIIFPYLNGEELNGVPDQSTPRYVIQFDERTLEESMQFEIAFQILEEKVKPERLKKDRNKYPRMVNEWWKFWNNRQELIKATSNFSEVLVHTRITKTHSFVFIPNNQIISAQVIVFALQRYVHFAFLQSNLHEQWAWKYGSTLKTDRRYSPTDCFETFPFPQNLTKETEAELEKNGEDYHEFRRQLMLDMQLGLTKTYNLFHDKDCNSNDIEKVKNIREFKSAKLQIPVEEAIQRIEKLRALHKQMDETVLKAYGWTDINLAHNFYEVDYLPENDRVRYTISPEARKEILKRLLELNHKIHAEEVAKGLWDKKGKKKTKTSTADKKQGGLFGQE